MKIEAAFKAYRMISSAQSEEDIHEKTSSELFYRCNNGDSNVEDRHTGGQKKVLQDTELKASSKEKLCQI